MIGCPRDLLNWLAEVEQAHEFVQGKRTCECLYPYLDYPGIQNGKVDQEYVTGSEKTTLVTLVLL